MFRSIAFGGQGLLDLLDPPLRAWLAEQGVRRSYADGEMIHRRGDSEPAMGVVITGVVRLTRLHANGTQTFVSSLQPGHHYGDVLFHSRARRTHDAWAVGAVQIDHYDLAAYQTLLERREVLLALHRVTAARLAGSISMADDLRGLSREAHLAKVLLSIRTNRDGSIDCLQEDLAALLGISVMTLAKALAVLRGQGLIETRYRGLRIVDRRRLRAWLSTQSPE